MAKADTVKVKPKGLEGEFHADIGDLVLLVNNSKEFPVHGEAAGFVHRHTDTTVSLYTCHPIRSAESASLSPQGRILTYSLSRFTDYRVLKYNDEVFPGEQ